MRFCLIRKKISDGMLMLGLPIFVGIGLRRSKCRRHRYPKLV